MGAPETDRARLDLYQDRRRRPRQLRFATTQPYFELPIRISDLHTYVLMKCSLQGTLEDLTASTGAMGAGRGWDEAEEHSGSRRPKPYAAWSMV